LFDDPFGKEPMPLFYAAFSKVACETKILSASATSADNVRASRDGGPTG